MTHQKDSQKARLQPISHFPHHASNRQLYTDTSSGLGHKEQHLRPSKEHKCWGENVVRSGDMV